MTTNLTNCIAAMTAICCSIATGGLAATGEGEFSVRGIGAFSCSQLTASLSTDEAPTVRQLLGAWIAGYISHANRSVEGVFDTVPIQDNRALAAIVAQICADNPDQLVESVMAIVADSFEGARAVVADEPVELVAGDRSVSLRPVVLQVVQERLIALGHLPSDATADGIFGPQTRTAIEAFQVEKGLSGTGLPDAQTLFALFFQG